MSENKSILSKRLKELREKNNLTQQDVAEKLGLSLSGYRKFEYSERDPNLDLLVEIATLYSVSTDFLLGVSNSILEDYLIKIKFDVYQAQNDMLANGMQYEYLRNSEEKDSFVTSQAKSNYLQAQGHYNKLLYQYMEEFFYSPNPNPYEDQLLKTKYPVKFDIQTDLFDGAFATVTCADGTYLGKIKYYNGGMGLGKEYALEKCEKYVNDKKRHFRLE